MTTQTHTLAGAKLLMEEVARHGCQVILDGSGPRIVGKTSSLPGGLLAKMREYKAVLVTLLTPRAKRRIINDATGEVLWVSTSPRDDAGYHQLTALAKKHQTLLSLEHQCGDPGGEEKWTAFAWCGSKDGS